MAPTVILAALAAVIVWGASPVASKIAVAGISALAVAALRTVIGGGLAVPVALLLRIPLPATARLRGILLLSGFCGFIGFPVIFTFGVAHTSANHASMILAALPIFTGAIAKIWDRQAPKPIWLVGSLIALVGEVVLITGRTAAGGGASGLSGDALVLLSNLFASLGYVAGGRLQQAGYPSTGTTFWGAAAAAILLLPVLALLFAFGGLGAELALAPPAAWLGIGYLAVFVTIVGYVLWYWALGQGGIARVGVLQFLQPVSGVALAALLLGEGVNLSFLVASGLVLFGVWLALKGK